MNEAAARAGCYLVIARAVASLVLGLFVFVGLLYVAVLSNLSSKLLDREFYAGILADADAYNRVYEEAVTETELVEEAGYIFGNVNVVNDEDKAGLLREVFPPEYLRAQTEGVIGSVVSYMDRETDELEAYVDFGPPLENLRPAVYAYIDRRIDGLGEVESARPPDCSQAAVQQLASGFQGRWQQLAGGDIPTSVPSLKSLDELCRTLVFEATFETLPSVTTRASLSGESLREDLRQAFGDADARQAVKVLARPLSEPLITDAIEELRRELEPDDRLDLVRKIAEDEGVSETEIRQGAADIRGWLISSQALGQTDALVIVVAGALIIGLMHLPRLGSVLRWPGITLLLSGAVCYLAGLVVHSLLTEAFEAALVQQSPLTEELAVSLIEGLTSGYGGAALIAMIVGALLLAASFAVPYLRARLDGGP